VSAGGPGPPRDEALVAYVEGIEAVLRTRRGADHVLSPRDFALARTWHEAGVPLATVLVAIDLAFDADPRAPSSLAVLRRRVEELAAVGPRPPAAPGPARETERVSLPEVQERLQALRERLLELPGRVAAQPLGEVEEIADLVAVASRPNWDYLRARLRRIDEAVAVAAVDALADDDARAMRAEAERTTARHRGRVDDAALDEARERLVRQRAREKLRLPRVSVD
jgi:hypothetical protein